MSRLLYIAALAAALAASSAQALSATPAESPPAEEGHAQGPGAEEGGESPSPPAPEGEDTPSPPSDEAVPSGQLTRMPSLDLFVEAPYPPEAEAEQLEAAVILLLELDDTGAVVRSEVVESSGYVFFDRAALRATTLFEFQPAEIDHVPAPVALQYRYEFVYRAPPSEQAPDEARRGVLSLEGRTLERGTRVPLPHAGVIAEKDGLSVDTLSDEEGRFRFEDLSPGVWRITVRAPGLEPFITDEEIVAGEVTTVTCYVRRRLSEYEAVVRAPREKKEVARRTLTLEEIRKIPGTQGDAIRVVQNLPGVARTPLNLGPLAVRGGRPGDTRTYIDGQLIPLLYHFGGLTAVINSDFLESLDFYPGNFPVRYGRSIAGAVDVNTRKANPERFRGYANINLTESTLFLEGPLGGKGAFAASVRRSYIDSVLPIVAHFVPSLRSVNFSVARYWDYQLKTDFDLGRDELSFFLFGSDDKLAAIMANAEQINMEGRSELSTNMSFHRLTGQWKRKLTPNLDHRLIATIGRDFSNVNMGGDLFLGLTLHSLTLRDDLSLRLSDSLTISAGLDVFSTWFRYEAQGPLPPPPGQFFEVNLSDNIQVASDEGWMTQPGLWIDAVWSPFKGLRLVPGVRFDYDTFIESAWVDPRLTALYDLTEKVLLKASVGRYHQPPSPEKLTRTFGNPALDEEGSTQYAAGIEWRFADLFSADLQFYYKDIFEEAVRAQRLQSEQAQALFGNQLLMNSGLGRAYGVELLLRKEPGDGFFGWIALSLGSSERRDAPGEPWVTSHLDQRYNIIAVVSRRFPWDIDVGIRVRWTEGSPDTPMEGGIYDADADQYLPLPSLSRRSARRPDFFQIDLRVDRRWVFERWILDAYVDILNVTNRRNPESYQYNYDYSQRTPSFGLPIIPAFGIRGEF